MEKKYPKAKRDLNCDDLTQVNPTQDSLPSDAFPLILCLTLSVFQITNAFIAYPRDEAN